MHPALKNTLAIVVGYILGALVNGALIEVSSSIIPPPNGIDISTLENLKATMHLFQPKHYLFPFFAHALGTFVGAYICARIATKKMLFAIIIGGVFFVGGIWMIALVPSPIWYTILDLALAYLPVAYLAGKLAK